MIQSLPETEGVPSMLQATGVNGQQLGVGLSPRSRGLVGAYARIWLWSLGALAVAFGAFLLGRAA